MQNNLLKKARILILPFSSLIEAVLLLVALILSVAIVLLRFLAIELCRLIGATPVTDWYLEGWRK